MKTIFTSLIVYFICLQANSQLWEVQNARLRVCWWSFGIDGISEYTNQGDTLINNEIYANIKFTEIDYVQDGNGIPDFYYSSFMPMIKRNDSLYFHNIDSNQDVLIFVFNLQSGQTFNMDENLIVDSCQTLDLTIKIDSSYTFNFQGNTFKRYYTSQIQDFSANSMQFRYDLNQGYPMDLQFNSQGQFLVGMFDELIGTCDFQILNCNSTCSVNECPLVYDYQYYQNGDSLRPNSFICESYILNINDLIQEDELVIYPNPCDKDLSIKGNKFELILFDVLGNQISTIKSNSNKEVSVIDVSNLPNGFYILRESSGKCRRVSIEH